MLAQLVAMSSAMKFCLVLAASAALVTTVSGGRGCLSYNGTQCVETCPAGMHAYHRGCEALLLIQRTCDDPYPKPPSSEEHGICDLARCDCNGSKVMDTRSGLCFFPHDCPIYVYTGHCPRLKFSFGKCYGDNTRQIMREIRNKGIFTKPLQYRTQDRYEIENIPQRDMPYPDHYDDIRFRSRPYITGYTGYVPGINFRYGKSFGRAADDSMAAFGERQRESRRRADDVARAHLRSRSAPKMESVHTRDEVRRTLREYADEHQYRDNEISAEFPPIAGYTGHIPRIKGTEASLSQRYHCAAKRGLELIQMERESRLRLQNADENIRAILKGSGKKRSYWNWG